MKNMIKLSLVAAVAVAGFSTAASASTLKEAFANGKVKGQIDSMYFMKDKETGTNKDSSIWVNGGKISYTTASYNGLTAGVTFQTSHVASDNDIQNNYAGDMDASGSVMSEAYLAYTLNNTTAKIGRQFVSTPLLAGSGSRMIKESFEAALLVNTDLPSTTLVAGVINKYQKRTDSADGIGKFNDLGDGIYTVYGKNTSVDNLTIQGQYATYQEATANTDYDLVYVDAAYKLDMVTLAAQAHFSDNGAATNSDGSLYGVKATAKLDAVTLTAAYTTTDDEAAVVRGVGEAAYKTFTAVGHTSGGFSYRADTDSFMLAASAKVADFALKLAYGNYDVAANSEDVEETNFIVGYSFNKELSAKVSYSVYDGYSYDNRVRTYLSYKF